jgi:hypothetical protein
VSLYLHAMNLTGTVPGSVSAFVDLEEFAPGNNHLSGVLPASISISGAWPKVRFVELYGNAFSGGLLPDLPYQRQLPGVSWSGCNLGTTSTFECPLPPGAIANCSVAASDCVTWTQMPTTGFCRLPGGSNGLESDYTLEETGPKNLADARVACKAKCVTKPSCVAVESNDRGGCEVWTTLPTNASGDSDGRCDKITRPTPTPTLSPTASPTASPTPAPTSSPTPPTVVAAADLNAQVARAANDTTFTLAADTTYVWSRAVCLGTTGGSYHCNPSSAAHMTLQGQGAGSSILDGGKAAFFFLMYAGAKLTLKNLTLANGRGPSFDDVGAIAQTGGLLVLDFCDFVNNTGNVCRAQRTHASCTPRVSFCLFPFSNHAPFSLAHSYTFLGWCHIGSGARYISVQWVQLHEQYGQGRHQDHSPTSWLRGHFQQRWHRDRRLYVHLSRR